MPCFHPQTIEMKGASMPPSKLPRPATHYVLADPGKQINGDQYQKQTYH